MLGGVPAVAGRHQLFRPSSASKCGLMYGVLDPMVPMRINDLRVSDDCKNLLRSLLQPDPNNRSSWESFAEHPFWRNDVANKEAKVKNEEEQEAHQAGEEEEWRRMPCVPTPEQTLAMHKAQKKRGRADRQEREQLAPSVSKQDAEIEELRAGNKELRAIVADMQARVSALAARQEVSSSAAARLSDAGAGAAPNVQQPQKLTRYLLPLIGDREGCEAGQEGSGEHAKAAGLKSPPAAQQAWLLLPPPSGEGTLAPSERRTLRRKLTASMLLGCARAQALLFCDEPDDAESVERAAVAESAQLLVGMSDHIQSFSPLVRSAYLVAFNLQSARAAFKRCHQNINAEARTAFFRLIYASLCQLHTSSDAADAPPHSLLNFLGTPSVSAAREQCILALNAPAMDTQGAEMPANFCELLKELLQCLTQPDPSPDNEPLFAVQRIPWTNERLIDWLRQLGDAPNDKESFQLA
jgi:hypothetical protein